MTLRILYLMDHVVVMGMGINMGLMLIALPMSKILSLLYRPKLTFQ